MYNLTERFHTCINWICRLNILSTYRTKLNYNNEIYYLQTTYTLKNQENHKAVKKPDTFPQLYTLSLTLTG